MNPKKSTQWLKTVGLDAVTIYDNNPYFFLFADIDTKNKEELLKVIVTFQRRGLSCYHYETTKGFHVISPTMLTIREWVLHKKALDFLQYRFDTIRITRRLKDGKKLFFNHYNKHYRRFESANLHDMLRKKFHYSPIEKHQKIVQTKLQYTIYMQLKFKNNTTFVVGESLWWRKPPQKHCECGLNLYNYSNKMLENTAYENE